MGDRGQTKKSREKVLAKMLSIIGKKPGIRPSELNRLLGLSHSANLRKALIKRSLVRKKREGVAVRYYPRQVHSGRDI